MHGLARAALRRAAAHCGSAQSRLPRALLSTTTTTATATAPPPPQGVAPSTGEPRAVVLLGHPALREVCAPCGADEALAADKAALVGTLQAFRDANGFGRGIAAPQIGVPRRFIAVNMGDGPRLLTDPEVTWRSEGTFTLFDDCMSLPWVLCKVRRHKSISVAFYNEAGERETWERCAQPLSELLQHELDHLDGRLIVDIAEGGGHGIVSREEFEREPQRFRAHVDYFIEPTL